MHYCWRKDSSAALQLLAALTVGLTICGSMHALPALPPPLPMSTEAAAADWEITTRVRNAKLQLADDDILARQVLEAGMRQRFTLRSKASAAGAYAVEAMVRCPTPASGRAVHGATLSVGVRGDAAAPIATYSLAVNVGRGRGDRYFSVVPRLGVAGPWAKTPLDGRPARAWGRGISLSPRFPLAKISPVMQDEFRRTLEADIQRIPLAHKVWRRLRIEVRPRSIRMYHNGLLVIEDVNRLQADGQVMLDLSGNVRLAGLRVERLEPTPYPYVSVPLDHLYNAAGPVAFDSIGAVAGRLTLQGIPLRLAAKAGGKDHVDIGASAFRYRMGIGYKPAAYPRITMPTVAQRDPARLILPVPNRAYRRAWILAAADGDKNSAPIITIRFFKPGAGFPLDAAATVPEFRAKGRGTPALSAPVKMLNGRAGRLWLIGVDLDAAALASDFREEPMLHMELTKQVKDHRAFPDPNNYGSYQGGLPSSVRLYGLTFEEAPLKVVATGAQNGNLYPFPQQPEWVVKLENQGGAEIATDVQIRVRSPNGKEEDLQSATIVPGGEQSRIVFRPTPLEYGLYRVQTTVSSGGWRQSRQGTFLTLPPDKRRATPVSSRWGVWNWGGGHGTNPDPIDNVRLMRALGTMIGYKTRAVDRRIGNKQKFRRSWKLAPSNNRIISRGVPAWSLVDPPDPAEYAKYSEAIGKKAADLVKEIPDQRYVNAFAEDSISLRTTHGLPPYAFGEPWFEYTDREKSRVRGYMLTAMAASEGIRKNAPKLKFILGHCSSNFFLPFFREKDWNTDFFDAFGLDLPQFEKMPERQPRAAEVSSLYFLYQEMKDRGIKKDMVHLESYFPSSHRLALGHRGQADSVVRTAVLSLALGSTKFEHCWSLHDCSDYWGTQHYGCIGFIGRKPEYNPKPAAAAYATMTQVLDTVEYAGYLDVGSRSAFCISFKDTSRKNLVYCLWTIRGSRPIELSTAADSELVQIDENGNQSPVVLADNKATLTLTPTPFWVIAKKGAVEKGLVGPPVYAPAPKENTRLLADFEKKDWRRDPAADVRFAENHWDVVREPGNMTLEYGPSADRPSTVMRVTQTEKPEGKPMVAYYAVFTPPKPIPIPGKAKALGIYGRGSSAWNRIVYEIVDAKGEIWQSAGTKDAWNCDDIHSWNYFNFDGWRYLQFPLPGNSPGDDFREKDSVWWGHSEEGVLDLPVKLTKIIVAMRTHLVYVNAMLPVDSLSLEFDDLTVVYDSAEAMTNRPVAVQRAAAGIMAPKSDGSVLPNPIAKLTADGVGAAPRITKLFPPEERRAGNRLYVEVAPVEGATKYNIYVAAYADGRGAMVLGSAEAEGGKPAYIRGLQPSIPLYFFATYVDAKKKESKPSAVRKTVLKDEFPMK